MVHKNFIHSSAVPETSCLINKIIDDNEVRGDLQARIGPATVLSESQQGAGFDT
jgi:hypothetical protein